MRFINDRVPWPYPADGALAFYRDTLLPNVAAGNEHAWSIRLRDQDTTRVGVISVAVPPASGNRGFWIASAHQRRGYACEASEVATNFYFDVLDEQALRVSKAVANSASCRISARQGMRIVWQGEKDYVSGRLPSETWQITQAEWRARTVTVL